MIRLIISQTTISAKTIPIAMPKSTFILCPH
jgi:hypothetical protein